MRKPNTAKATVATDLRLRAARARDAAGRFIKRGGGEVTDQPQSASLPEASAADRPGSAFSPGPVTSHDAVRGRPDRSSRADAVAGREPCREQDMGRHETFGNAAPISEDLLSGTMLGRGQGAADAELLQLGREFDAALARQRPLREEYDQIEEIWARTSPKRPTCLVYRESDRAFGLRRWGTSRRVDDGENVGPRDIIGLRGHTFMRGVPRPATPEDNLPPDAHTVVEAKPWPEAQARADEIIAAWDAWDEERDRHNVESGQQAAEDRLDAADDEILALANRIAELPATTAEGLRIKLRASAEYVEEHDDNYPNGRLLNSLLRDAQLRMSAPVSPLHPDAALIDLGTEFIAAWVAEVETNDGAGYRACNRLAQQIVQTPAVTVVGLGIKALLLARLDEDDSSPRKPAKAQGPVASHWNVLRQVQEGAARLAKINTKWGA